MSTLRPLRVGTTLKRTLKALAYTGAATGTIGLALYSFATREQKFHELSATTDPLALSSFMQTLNPHSNKSLSDIYEARIPLATIRPELLADFKRGGTKLVESYCSGLLGRWGFAVQRQLSIRHAKQAGSIGPRDVYTKDQILSCKFEQGKSPADMARMKHAKTIDIGTEISGHFVVLEKTPTSILLRGGSPSDENGLREVDSFMQGVVDVDDREGVAVFQLKCIFYNGQVKGSPPPLPEAVAPLHLIYAKALAANGVANCKI